jgi:H+/Cl- antiporter ClcA
MRWFFWLYTPSLCVGVLTGVSASCVFATWLEVANRFTELERFAGLRDLVAGGILIVVLAVPILRFRQQPGKLIAAGLTAWTLLTIAYLAAELRYTLLDNRMGSFHVLVLGAVSYGLVAVLDWVFLMCADVRHQHIVQSREATASPGRQRAH